MSHRVQLRPRRDLLSAYSGTASLITGLYGQVSTRDHGYFVDDTRLLSRALLRAKDRTVDVFSAGHAGSDAILAHARLIADNDLLDDAIYLELAWRTGALLRLDLLLSNRSPHRTVAIDVGLELAADFTDLNDVINHEERAIAPVQTDWDEREQRLRFTWKEPRLERAAELRVSGARPVPWDGRQLTFSAELRPGDERAWTLELEALWPGSSDGRAHLLPALRSRIVREAPAIRTTNSSVARAWETAVADIASLPLGQPEGPAALAAGVPMYQRFFGRDTLTAGWQGLLAGSLPLRDALLANAALQGRGIDDWRDEEPGKMIHQARRGPNSLLGIDPVERYYGDYATAPDFLVMLGQYFSWTNDRETVRKLLPAARRAATWCERFGDLDGDGFMEYVTRSEQGVKNQGWKDAPDSVVDEHGDLVPNPIAASEIQGYWFAGLMEAALVFALVGRDFPYAVKLVRQAIALRKRFNQRFWVEEMGCFASGLGPNKEPIRSVTSNDAHLLASGIVELAKAPLVVERMFAPDMFSGWGLRTLSSTHPAYDPFSYHRGSVWPVENGTFALGLARYGQWPALYRLAEAIFASADLFEEHRLPEVIGGLPRDDAHPHPGLYPRSNAPQAWSASMIVLLVQTFLGLNPMAPLGFAFVDPHLPPWLPDLQLRGVRVGNSEFDFALRRTRKGDTKLKVRRRNGRVRIMRMPPPEDPRGTPLKRAALLVPGVARFVPLG